MISEAPTNRGGSNCPLQLNFLYKSACSRFFRGTRESANTAAASIAAGLRAAQHLLANWRARIRDPAVTAHSQPATA